jgi:hypothetical protein
MKTTPSLLEQTLTLATELMAEEAEGKRALQVQVESLKAERERLLSLLHDAHGWLREGDSFMALNVISEAIDVTDGR